MKKRTPLTMLILAVFYAIIEFLGMVRCPCYKNRQNTSYTQKCDPCRQKYEGDGKTKNRRRRQYCFNANDEKLHTTTDTTDTAIADKTSVSNDACPGDDSIHSLHTSAPPARRVFTVVDDNWHRLATTRVDATETRGTTQENVNPMDVITNDSHALSWWYKNRQKQSQLSLAVSSIDATQTTDTTEITDAVDTNTNDASDATDTSDAVDTNDAFDATDASDAPDTSDTVDTNDASDATDTSDAVDTNDASDATETSDATDAINATNATNATNAINAINAINANDAIDTSGAHVGSSASLFGFWT
jgi:hypothetical protein